MLQLNASVSFKAPGSRNFNYLYGFTKLNVCDAMNAKNPPLLFKPVAENCKNSFPDICHGCPYPLGPVAVNYTEHLDEKSCPNVTNKNMPILSSGSWFPDGDYRVSIKLYSKNDSEILTVNYFYRMKTGDKKSF